LNGGEVVLYSSPNGDVSLDVLVEHESVAHSAEGEHPFRAWLLSTSRPTLRVETPLT